MPSGSFLSTLSLRRATNAVRKNQIRTIISIHALLAESDLTIMLYDTSALIFLSTLSLRRATFQTRLQAPHSLFLSTLSLRRATNLRVVDGSKSSVISIHALLAESDLTPARILSRLLEISIHALLAESDPPRGGSCYLDNIITNHAILAVSDLDGSDSLRHSA